MKTLRTKLIGIATILLGTWLLIGCGSSSGSAPQIVASGSLDKNFGDNGIVTVDGSKQDIFTDVICKSDGTLLTTGYIERTATLKDGTLSLFSNVGNLDTTFGVSNGTTISSLLKDDLSNAMTIDGNENIFLAGYLTNTSDHHSLVIAKYTPNGILDTTYGTTGAFVLGANGLDMEAVALAIDNNGKIIVASTIKYSNTKSNILIFRLLSNGTVDTSFGTNGFREYGEAQEDTAEDITIDENGNILVVGTMQKNNGNKDIVILRLQPNGTYDTTFDIDGIATLNIGQDDEGNAITTDSNGKILITGKGNNLMTIARYNANGVLDSEFGINGIIQGSTVPLSSGEDLLIDDNDNILITGYILQTATDYRMAVWRYDTTGKIDSTFGTQGVSSFTGGLNMDFGVAIAIDNNQKIVVVGGSYQGAGKDIDVAIWRINP